MQARSLFLILSLLPAQDKPVELKEFSSPEGGFTVLLPGTPREQVSKTGSVGEHEIVNHVFVVDQKAAVYAAAYMIDPGLAKIEPEGVRKVLENARKGTELGLKARLLSEKEIALDKHPGVEFQLDVAGRGVYRARVYVVADRLLQVSVLGPRDIALGEEADRVLDSFRLTK
jgi:hypothetical protein